MKNNKRESGFSLLEVIIAMTILAFGLLGVIAIFRISEYGLNRGNRLSIAIELAKEKMEYKRSLGYKNLLLDDLDGDGKIDVRMVDDGTNGDEKDGDGIFTFEDEADKVTRRWTVDMNNQNNGWSVITVITSWVEGKGIKKRYKISSGITDGIVH